MDSVTDYRNAKDMPAWACETERLSPMRAASHCEIFGCASEPDEHEGHWIQVFVQVQAEGRVGRWVNLREWAIE